MTARSDVLLITDKTKLLKSALGQSRPKWAIRTMSGSPPLATGMRISLLVRFVPNSEVATISRLPEHRHRDRPELSGEDGNPLY